MPMTQHAPAPVSLPREDQITTRSPPSYSPLVEVRPIVPHQPSRDSPPPPAQTVSRSPSPQPPTSPSRSSPQRETPAQSEEAPAPVAPAATAAAAAAEAPSEEQAQDDEEEADDEPIVMETFQQILELDEDDDREFSKEMVWAYFSQAEKTFGDLDEALSEQDLPKLSHLGHYLKGSSAAMGIRRVEKACERIQHYGQLRDEEKSADLTSEEALALIRTTLRRVKVDYEVADRWLRKFYEEEN